jgi:methionine aminopeptidase
MREGRPAVASHILEVERVADLRETRRQGELQRPEEERLVDQPPSIEPLFSAFLTIEPMVSAGSDHPIEDANGWTIRTRDGSLAAHHEHTLVITRERPLI